MGVTMGFTYLHNLARPQLVHSVPLWELQHRQLGIFFSYDGIAMGCPAYFRDAFHGDLSIIEKGVEASI